jgi:hypothetical protein
MLKLRKANESDLDTVVQIFKLAIEEMDKNNINQWDNNRFIFTKSICSKNV